jgi:hypothetical protein
MNGVAATPDRAKIRFIDRLSGGQDDEVDLAAAGLVADLLHHRQRAVGTGAHPGSWR